MRIDAAGDHEFSGCVDRAPGLNIAQHIGCGNGDDFPVCDGDVPEARAVRGDDVAAPDDEIEHVESSQ